MQKLWQTLTNVARKIKFFFRDLFLKEAPTKTTHTHTAQPPKPKLDIPEWIRRKFFTRKGFRKHPLHSLHSGQFRPIRPIRTGNIKFRTPMFRTYLHHGFKRERWAQ